MELIVFDLDGTLLNSDSKISAYTKETLLRLSERNIAYTVATGRALHSAQDILAGHGFELPHVYSNGVIIWNPAMASLSLENVLAPKEVQHVIRAALEQGVTPFVSTVKNEEHFIFHSPVRYDVEQRLLQNFYERPTATVLPMSELPDDAQITNISMLGQDVLLENIRSRIDSESHLIVYSGSAIEGNGLMWMDVHHCDASKGGAINVLKERFGFTTVVCFGDSENDLSMFAMADECYAPDNAKPDIKAVATSVIGHHDNDGVARFLRERFDL